MKSAKTIWLFTALMLLCAILVGGCGSAPNGMTDAASAEMKQVAAINVLDLAKGKVSTAAQSKAGASRETRADIWKPEASGKTVYTTDGASIDASNTSEGYVMVKYDGSAAKAKVQVTTPDGVQNIYNLKIGDYETFPLVGGDGAYTVDVYENAYDNMYAMICSEKIDVSIEDEFKPFLYPNQYVWFVKESDAVAYAREVSQNSSDDLNFVTNVYNYVIKNITYDVEKAETVTNGYLPVVDETLKTGKGICFDYASLMAAMLRSQGVPTKLQIGYSGEAYHAWISVYLEESGWVDNIIQFDGKAWSLMDPTLAASNSESAVKKYVGDGSNYILKYSY